MSVNTKIWDPEPVVYVQDSASGQHLAWAFLGEPGLAIVSLEAWDPSLSGDGNSLNRPHRVVAAPSDDVSGETLFVAPIVEVWPPGTTVPFTRLVLDTSGYEIPGAPDPADQLDVTDEERPLFVDALQRALKSEPPEGWLAAANAVAAQQTTTQDPDASRSFPFERLPRDPGNQRTVCDYIKICGRRP